MLRIHLAAMIGIVGVGALYGGQIQIGGTSGLTTSYITSGCTTSAVGSTGVDGCNTTGGVTLKGTTTGSTNYSQGLFSQALGPTGIPDHGTLQDTNSNTGGSALAPVTFDLMNNGSTCNGGNDCNDWVVSGNSSGVSNANSNLTIPIGVYGVDTVWTMLNDYWGTNSLSMLTVNFNFANDQAGTSGLTTVSVQLANGVEIRSAVDCTSSLVTPTPPTTGNGSCPSQYGASGSGYGQIGTALPSGATTISGVNVSASNLYSSGYSGTSSSSNVPYYNTAGNVVLDDQEFSFGTTYEGMYLVSINFNDISKPGVSRAALSAVTVDTILPEPSTNLLLIGGLSAIALFARRRKITGTL
jgi:hypothetical protein